MHKELREERLKANKHLLKFTKKFLFSSERKFFKLEDIVYRYHRKHPRAEKKQIKRSLRGYFSALSRGGYTTKFNRGTPATYIINDKLRVGFSKILNIERLIKDRSKKGKKGKGENLEWYDLEDIIQQAEHTKRLSNDPFNVTTNVYFLPNSEKPSSQFRELWKKVEVKEKEVKNTV